MSSRTSPVVTRRPAWHRATGSRPLSAPVRITSASSGSSANQALHCLTGLRPWSDAEEEILLRNIHLTQQFGRRTKRADLCGLARDERFCFCRRPRRWNCPDSVPEPDNRRARGAAGRHDLIHEGVGFNGGGAAVDTRRNHIHLSHTAADALSWPATDRLSPQQEIDLQSGRSRSRSNSKFAPKTQSIFWNKWPHGVAFVFGTMRDWSLYRDLAEPDMWRESYRMQTKRPFCATCKDEPTQMWKTTGC